MKKQLVSILLTLCMVLPLMPTAAWAAEKPADAPVLVEQGDSSAATAEKPAAEPSEKDTETPAPEPLPTGIALCSYESKDGKKEGNDRNIILNIKASIIKYIFRNIVFKQTAACHSNRAAAVFIQCRYRCR